MGNVIHFTCTDLQFKLNAVINIYFQIIMLFSKNDVSLSLFLFQNIYYIICLFVKCLHNKKTNEEVTINISFKYLLKYIATLKFFFIKKVKKYKDIKKQIVFSTVF